MGHFGGHDSLSRGSFVLHSLEHPSCNVLYGCHNLGVLHELDEFLPADFLAVIAAEVTVSLDLQLLLVVQPRRGESSGYLPLTVLPFQREPRQRSIQAEA